MIAEAGRYIREGRDVESCGVVIQDIQQGEKGKEQNVVVGGVRVRKKAAGA